MVKAIKEITEILTAIGAKPERITRPDGSTEIKINAPKINGENGGTNEN